MHFHSKIAWSRLRVITKKKKKKTQRAWGVATTHYPPPHPPPFPEHKLSVYLVDHYYSSKHVFAAKSERVGQRVEAWREKKLRSKRIVFPLFLFLVRARYLIKPVREIVLFSN